MSACGEYIDFQTDLQHSDNQLKQRVDLDTGEFVQKEK
jgi:hypothetical protein